METLIERLVALSDTDMRLTAARGELEAARASVSEAESALSAEAGSRDAVKRELEAAKAEDRAVQRKIEEYQRQRARAIQALETGAGDAAAAERQRVQCEDIIDGCETRVLELMEIVEAIKTRHAEAESRVRLAELALAGKRSEAPVRIESLQAEIEALTGQRTGLYQELPIDVRRRYDLLLARKPPPVARVLKNACRQCRIAVQPQMMIEIGRGRLQECRGCGRWLAPD